MSEVFNPSMMRSPPAGDGDPGQLGDTAESRHEKRLEALNRQIAQLEAENVAEREWTMKGEVSSKQRPVNSLLEQDLEFENVAKTVPQVTAEVTASLEDRIKNRILDVSPFLSTSRQRLIGHVFTG